MAGKPQKTVEAKILTGTFRPDRDVHPDKQVRAGGEPERPPTLQGEALAFWDRVVPGLVISGVAAACDTPSLTLLCEWWARYVRIGEALDALPVLGKANQMMVQLAIATDKFDKIASKFGLAPSDRVRLKVNPVIKPVSKVDTRKRG